MKLSIITINWNNAEGLARTLDSVKAQTCKEFEHVIVDGASTDGSVEIIQSYVRDVSSMMCDVLWVSEKDTGIYNAMNKGIRMAKGEYLLFLNSGDVLVDGDVVKKFNEVEVNADIATGIERLPSGELIYPKKDSELSYSYFYEDTLLHQSTFIRKDAFERYGMYREDYRIVSDWEWFFRVLVRDGASYQPLDFVVADFDGTGMSCNAKCRQLHDEEREKVHQTFLPRVRRDYDELMRLREIETEYRHLKSGKMGWLVRLMLKCKKGLKKK